MGSPPIKHRESDYPTRVERDPIREGKTAAHRRTRETTRLKGDFFISPAGPGAPLSMLHSVSSPPRLRAARAHTSIPLSAAPLSSPQSRSHTPRMLLLCARFHHSTPPPRNPRAAYTSSAPPPPPSSSLASRPSLSGISLRLLLHLTPRLHHLIPSWQHSGFAVAATPLQLRSTQDVRQLGAEVEVEDFNV